MKKSLTQYDIERIKHGYIEGLNPDESGGMKAVTVVLLCLLALLVGAVTIYLRSH